MRALRFFHGRTRASSCRRAAIGGDPASHFQHFGSEPVSAVTRAGCRAAVDGRLCARAACARLGHIDMTTIKMTRRPPTGRPDYAAMAEILLRIAAELRARAEDLDDQQDREQAERLERIAAAMRDYFDEP